MKMFRVENEEMFWDVNEDDLGVALRNLSCKICIRFPEPKHSVHCYECSEKGISRFEKAEISEIKGGIKIE